MKNTLILHGTDFQKEGEQCITNWFPWLKAELEKQGYDVWLPELPEAWHPDLERYWNFLKNFDFNDETLLIGHSSGAAAMFGVLHKLPENQKIGLAVSVAGFYKDEGWGCEGLFTQIYDWEKIKRQAEKIEVIYSDNDPYVSPQHASYFGEKLGIVPHLMLGKKHFNLEAGNAFHRFPELLNIINIMTS